MVPVMRFSLIYHTATYQYDGTSEKCDFYQIGIGLYLENNSIHISKIEFIRDHAQTTEGYIFLNVKLDTK